MLYQLIDVNFTPYCEELNKHLNYNSFEFESSDSILSALEEHYSIKIQSLAWCNVIDQIDCDGPVTVTLNTQCVLLSAIMSTRLVGIPYYFRNDPNRKLIGGLGMILAEWIHNYKCHDDAINARDIDPYNGSPFKVYKEMSSKRKGKYFELLFEEYADNMGWKVEDPDNSNHDTKINGKKVEIKGSLLWGSDGSQFRWQQIRPAQDYDVIVFIAIYPDRIEFHGASKEDVSDFVQTPDKDGNYIHNQHGGKTVNSGTFFLDGFPEDYKFMTSLDRVL